MFGCPIVAAKKSKNVTMGNILEVINFTFFVCFKMHITMNYCVCSIHALYLFIIYRYEIQAFDWLCRW